MSNVKVSVIIPVYNSEKYLKTCLDSIINQTLKDIEIICVDDGSTDKSPNILKKYSSNDNRIHLVSQKNKDVGATRGKGVEIARGEYIAFVDNDDWLVLDALEKLYNFAQTNKSDLVLFNVDLFYSDTNTIDKDSYYNINKYFNKSIDFDNFTAKDVKPLVMRNFPVWYKLYKTEFLKSYDDFYFKEKITIPDVPLHVQTMLRAKKISFLPDHLYFYRRNHAESMLNFSKETNRVFDIFEVIDEVENFLRENGLMLEYNDEFNIFKIDQINYWFERCGNSYKEKFFIKSKEAFNNLNLSTNNLELLPKKYSNLYLDIINSNSYNEAEMRKKFYNLKKRNKNLKNENINLKKENKTYKLKLKNLYNSNSWKLTKPIRFFGKMLKKK